MTDDDGGGDHSNSLWDDTGLDQLGLTDRFWLALAAIGMAITLSYHQGWLERLARLF